MVYRLVLCIFFGGLINSCKSVETESTLFVYDLASDEYVVQSKFIDSSNHLGSRGQGQKFIISSDVRKLKMIIKDKKYSIRIKNRFVIIGTPLLDSENEIFIRQCDSIEPTW